MLLLTTCPYPFFNPPCTITLFTSFFGGNGTFLPASICFLFYKLDSWFLCTWFNCFLLLLLYFSLDGFSYFLLPTNSEGFCYRVTPFFTVYYTFLLACYTAERIYDSWIYFWLRCLVMGWGLVVYRYVTSVGEMLKFSFLACYRTPGLCKIKLIVGLFLTSTAKHACTIHLNSCEYTLEISWNLPITIFKAKVAWFCA